MRISDWSSDVCSSDLFLRAARPHGALDLWLGRQDLQRFLQRLVRGQLAHADAFGLVRRNAKGHFFLFETKNIKFQLHAGDLGFLQLDDAPHAMLRINDIVTDLENGGACGHSSSFLWPCSGTGKRVNSFISGPLRSEKVRGGEEG